MSKKETIEQLLAIISKLGSPNTTSSVNEVNKCLDSISEKLAESQTLKIDFDEHNSKYGINELDDVVIRLGCVTASLLDLLRLSHEEETDRCASGGDTCTNNLISINLEKVIENCSAVVIFSSILSCLDEEGQLYPKLVMVKRKTIIGGAPGRAPQDLIHRLLFRSSLILLRLFRNSNLGRPLRKCFTGEVLSCVLQLGFSIDHKKEVSDREKIYEELELFLSCVDDTVMLRQILLLKGVAATSKSRKWLLRTCSTLHLRRYLLRPPQGDQKYRDGVRLTLRASLDIVDGDDWRQCEAVASLLGTPTKDCTEYYATIGPQVVEILVGSDVTRQSNIVRVLSLAIGLLYEKNPSLCSQYIGVQLLQPLLSLTDSNTHSDFWGKSAVDNTGKCVSVLYNTFVCAGGGASQLLKPVLRPLLVVSSASASSTSKTHALCLIVKYLSNTPSTKELVRTLLVMTGLEQSPDIPPVRDGFLSGEITDNTVWEERSKSLEEVSKLSGSIIKVLTQLKNNKAVKGLVHRLPHYIDFSVTSPNKDTLNQVEENFTRFHRVVISCSLLSELPEELIEVIFSDLSDAIPLLVSLLEVTQASCTDSDLQSLQESLLLNQLLLMRHLITTLHTGKKLSSSDWEELQSLLPPLNTLHTSLHLNELLTEFVRELQLMIESRGTKQEKGSFEELKERLSGERKGGLLIREEQADREVNPPSSSVQKPLRSLEEDSEDENEIICEREPSSFPKTGSVYNPMAVDTEQQVLQNVPENSCNDLPATHTSTYKQAMEEVCSPILPEKGHGLLSLYRLLDARDKETLANKSKLLSLFQHTLKDEDSYIYLMAVQGMASLCQVYPQDTLKVLCKELNGHRTAEDRAKVAEAITRSVRKLVPNLARFKNLLMSTLLKGASDPECLVRTACLSSLGELCKELGKEVHSDLNAVLQAVLTVLQCDDSVEPRRAAVLLVTLLLRGLGSDIIAVLKEAIRDIYRALKTLSSTDEDEVVRVHAGLALDEIDNFMKEFITQNTNNKIYFTERPSIDF